MLMIYKSKNINGFILRKCDICCLDLEGSEIYKDNF